MAFENTKETVMAEVKKNNRGDYIIVKKVESEKGAVSVDIRHFFTNDAGEVMPTKKGVRFNSEMALEIIKAQLECLEDSDLQDVAAELNGILSSRGIFDEDDEDEGMTIDELEELEEDIK